LRLRVLPDREREPPLDDRLLEPDDRVAVRREDDDRPTDQVLRERVDGRDPPQSYDWLWPVPPASTVNTSSQSNPPPP